MANYLPPETGNFEQPPPGSELGVCVRVIDLGTQRNEYQGEVSFKRQLMIVWELPEAKMQDGKPFMIANWYTYSSHPKSSLRQDLEAWRGAAFKKEEISEFDINRLLGKGCMLGIIHTDTGRARIKSIMRLPRGISAPTPTNELLGFSLTDRPFDHLSFDKLSERLQGRIKASPEYKDAVEGRDPNEKPPPPNEGDYGATLDDDIPF